METLLEGSLLKRFSIIFLSLGSKLLGNLTCSTIIFSKISDNEDDAELKGKRSVMTL